MLQPVRAGIATVLGDRPAILAVQARDHPSHQLAGMPQRLVTGEIAARSDRSPPRTPSATDQGLRYEPRRPRHHSDVFTNSEQCRGHRPYQRRHATTAQSRTRRVGGWRGGEWFGCRSGRSCLGFPPGSFRFDRGRYRFRFQPPPVKPCMRFSRTRLTDVLHRRRSAFQARNGLGGTTIPSRLIRPRWLGELSTWVIPQPQARRRLPRLDSHSASRVKA